MSLLSRNLPHNTLILLGATTLITGVYLFRLIISYLRKPKYPTISTIDGDLQHTLQKGVAMYPDTPFRLQTEVPILILPKSAINDIKTLPDSTGTFQDFFLDEFPPKYTGLPESLGHVIELVKNELTRHIPNSLVQVQDELKYSFDKELGICDNWVNIVLYQKVARIVGTVSSRVLVGLPLSRNEEWVESIVNYTLHVMSVKDALKKWPSWMKHIVAPHLKEVHSLNQFRKRIVEQLKPIIDAQLAKYESEKLHSSSGDKEGLCISWIISRLGLDASKDTQLICSNFFSVLFAAIHTTSATVTQAIFDLAAYREYIPILREELQQVILKDGCQTSEGRLQFSKSSMAKLSKLDSFLKESQRINSLSLISHIRIIQADFRLSNGCLISKGTRLSLPSSVIENETPDLFSPGLTKPLSEFDGLRNHNLRRLPGNENRHYFVSTSNNSLSFGHGKHSCPGRFFAGNEIKAIFVELLSNWEFRYVGDEMLEGGAWRRPENRFTELERYPNAEAHLEIRRRRF